MEQSQAVAIARRDAPGFPHVLPFSTFRDHPLLHGRLHAGDLPRRSLEIAVVLALAVQAARLAWLLLPPAGLDAPAGPPPPDTGPLAARLAIDAFHPTPARVASADTSALRLFAVRPAAAGGSAILATEGGPQRSFATGDEIAPGVTLAEVRPDHVVLESAGGRGVLRFAGPGARPANAALPGPAPVPATAAAPAPATDDAPTAVDPARLLAQMGLRPEQADGRVTGYAVIPRGDGAVLRQAGLQAGDVLLSVNNEALDAERHARLGEVLAGASTITLTYRRDGRIHTATLQAPTP